MRYSIVLAIALLPACTPSATYRTADGQTKELFWLNDLINNEPDVARTGDRVSLQGMYLPFDYGSGLVALHCEVLGVARDPGKAVLSFITHNAEHRYRKCHTLALQAEAERPIHGGQRYQSAEIDGKWVETIRLEVSAEALRLLGRATQASLRICRDQYTFELHHLQALGRLASQMAALGE